MQGHIHPFTFSVVVPECISQFCLNRGGMSIQGYFRFSPVFLPTTPSKARVFPALPAAQLSDNPACRTCCLILSLGRGSTEAALGNIRESEACRWSSAVPRLSHLGWMAKKRLAGNLSHGLCFCAGLQAHPEVPRDRVAPEWTRGDGACTDLLTAGKWDGAPGHLCVSRGVCGSALRILLYCVGCSPQSILP